MKEQKQYNNKYQDFVSILFQRWRIILLITLIIGALAAIYAFIKSPQYTVKATVMISEDASQGSISLVNKLSIGNLLGGSASVDNEQYIMSSHEVYQKMVKNLGLNTTYSVKDGWRKKFVYPVAPVIMECDPDIADTLSTGLKFNVTVNKEGLLSVKAKRSNGKSIGTLRNVSTPALLKTDYGDFTFVVTDKYRKSKELSETIGYTSYTGMAEYFDEIVKVCLPSKRADMISLSIKHVDPKLGKLVLNEIISIYNDKGGIEKNKKGIKILSFLDERINSVEKELVEIEKNLENYKKSNKISDIKADMTYAYETHGELQMNIIQIESRLQALNLIKAYLNDDNGDVLIPEISLNNENEIKSISQYNQLVLKRIELAKGAREGNIALKQLDENISATRSAILQTVNQAIKTTSSSLSELKNKDELPENKIREVPTVERDMREIVREQSIQEQIYIFLLEQREQIAMTYLNSLPRGIVIDEPYVLSKPAGAGKGLIILVGLISGLIIGWGSFYIKFLIKQIADRKAE